MIKPFIVIAALLLAAGCSSSRLPSNPQPPVQNKVQTRTHNAAPMKNLTQASSISTSDMGATIQQTPGDASNLLDWLNPVQAPGQTPGQAPGQVPGQAPVQSPSTAYPNPQQPAKPPTQMPPNTVANPQQPGDSSQFAQQVLDLVNQERSKAGLKPLTMNSNLSKVAMAKAQDMYNNNYFDHQSPTYGSPFDMMKSFGITYRSAGENIAKGQSSPTEVMNQWMNSPGHRANILNGSFTEIGVAYYNRDWVQEFTG